MEEPNPTNKPATNPEITALDQRCNSVSAAIRELFKVAVEAIRAESLPDGQGVVDPEKALGAGLSLLEIALISVNEIADAQQRMAALMEAEHVMAMEAQEADKRTAEAEANAKNNPSRSFIGKGIDGT